MLLYVLVLSATLFFVGLLAKNTILRKLCVLCASISATWVILLIWYKLGLFHNQVLLAMLMGQSVTGAFYLARRHAAKALRVFTLPFFLSLTVLAYWAVGGQVAVLPVMGFLLALWAAAYWLLVSRGDTGRRAASVVMECCGEEKK